MKKCLLILLICIIVCKVEAQEWFPVGAKWTYSVIHPMAGHESMQYGIQHMECTKDTVIDGITAKVLNWRSMCTFSYDENIFYYNDTADILCYYVDSAFRPYFDFSKKAGETYYMYFPGYSGNSDIHYDSLLITVISDTIKTFAGIDVRCQYVSGNSTYSFTYFSGEIIEYMGCLGSLYPVDGGCDHDYISDLRCYHDNTFSYYAKPIYEEQGCDIKLSVSDNYQNYDIKIFPNPTSGQLIIENEELRENSIIEIYNVVGQCVYTTSLRGTKCRSNPENNHENSGLLRYARNDEVVIDISHLASGMYFLKVDNKINKFIKF